MESSPLQLRHYVLRKILIEPIEGWQRRAGQQYPDNDGLPMEAHIELGSTEKANTFGVRLSIKSEPSGVRFPYRFELGAEGYVEVLAAKDDADRRQLALVNGTSLLYGVLRETFLSLTHRFGNGPMMLPTMHFLDLKKELVEKSETGRTIEQAPSPSAAKRRRIGRRAAKAKSDDQP